MKKFYILLLIFFSGLAFSQVTFKPGIRGGANFSHFSQGDNLAYYSYYDGNSYQNGNSKYDFKTRTDFYVGIFGNIRFTKFYALQPEINYSRQGSKLNSASIYDRESFSISYLGAQIVNKFYFNKFNVLVGPTLEFVVSKDFTPANEIDLGITAGAGYDITKNFGVEARVKKGFVQVINYDDNHSNVVFQAGVYYTFNMK